VDFGLKVKSHTRYSSKHAAIMEDSSPAVARFQRRESLRRGSKTFGTTSILIENSQMAANPKELAFKIKKLYAASIATFVNQIAQNSCKNSNQRNDTLKRVPECVLNNQSFKQAIGGASMQKIIS